MSTPVFDKDNAERSIRVERENTSSAQLATLMRTLAAHALEAGGHCSGDILIVEDNANNSLLMEDILDSLQMRCHIARDASEAIQHCLQHTPCLILMDIGLPEMDGLSLTAHLRQNKKFEHTPVIAVSAHSGERIQDRAQEVGCDDFLSKPFTPNQFIEMIDRYTDRQLV